MNPASTNPNKVLSMVLAGGEGKRLLPLTLDRAKPAVPFGSHYRLIDFPLSNLANGGYRKIVVLTQYKSHSLDRHLALTWRMSAMLGNYVAAETIAAKESASRLAPPTSAPSISGCPRRVAALSGFTLPPY